ncbi:ABC transporter ATP-binding protein [Burkholderia multivorans]|jgi:simple sugar transport system ATP-binding protein|uniref:ABC transporter ATP-binding protein n=2 Tax=Pseudomonadota TaxID=1224 RepID=UPI00070C5553|nr:MULTISPECIES: ABC transporter ATP-binding protein [Pseudomonadota]MBU9510543.1 ABC transporter ATP-binding protein [Burkholderia multivorans]SOV33010.1 Xylose import ATP-binding protein XylG [Pseudomonas aeruginosa]
MTRALLEMRGISKSYGSVQANRRIDLTVMPGEIVGLLGENGSGKSTLMKVLFGMVRPDEGDVVYQGRQLEAGSPRAALEQGIAMIHQHFTLVEAMTVSENLMLGWSRDAGPWLNHAATARKVREAAAHYGLEVDPDARVEQLALGEKQRVEILKAILRGAHLLILDEPSSILSPPEIERLLAFLKRFRAEGHSVVFITHKLGEVLEVADRVVVLRDGQVVGATDVAGATRESLARLMVGRELAPPAARAASPAGKVRLQVEGLAARDASGVERLRGASFTLRAGEVLALAGIDGNGQGELANTLAGITVPTAGRILLDGVDITRGNARTRLAAGIAYIPADRAGTSLVQGMSIEDNLVLRDIDQEPYSSGGRIARAVLRRLAQQRMREFDIRAASPQVPARTLSGGNQQKVALARELSRQPRVVIAFQPTWGLDPGATRFVVESLLKLRQQGAAVLYISSELEEVLAVGDRIGVLSGGRILHVVDRAQADLESIGLAMAGARTEKEMA